MKKTIFVFCILLLLLFSAACSKPHEEYLYYYNGKAYSSDCQYGHQHCSFGMHWDLVSNEQDLWEDITVNTKPGEEKAQKYKGDISTDFIRVHDMLCVRKDFDLPNIETNKKEITQINVSFHDKVVSITDRNEIDSLVDVITKANRNTQKTNDHNYEYVGELNVFFDNIPMFLSAGRILEDKSGALFFSSRINSNINTNSLFTSFYSVPLPSF